MRCPAGSIYITIANSGYQADWVQTGALDCCSNITGTVLCGSSSGISVSATQNVTIGSESSYQYIFNISKPILVVMSWPMQQHMFCVHLCSANSNGQTAFTHALSNIDDFMHKNSRQDSQICRCLLACCG